MKDFKELIHLLGVMEAAGKKLISVCNEVQDKYPGIRYPEEFSRSLGKEELKTFTAVINRVQVLDRELEELFS